MTQKFKQYITLSIIGASIIFSSATYADRANPLMPSNHELFPTSEPPHTNQQPEVLELPIFEKPNPIFTTPDYSDVKKCTKDAGDAFGQCLVNGGELEDCRESMDWVVKNVCTPLVPPAFTEDLMP